MLEAVLREDNAFVNLTYSEEHLPRVASTSVPTLRPKDLTDWLKRLRRAIQPSKIRYYAVGEYGDVSWRPHYHVALFGYPTCLRGGTRPNRAGVCCPPCDLVRRSWGLGLVHLGSLERESAQYVCGYVTKKMTSPKDDRLEGRYPEFARMSLRPGIGADAMHEIASQLLTYDLEKKLIDVPLSLRHGAHNLPLGRYLRRHLRELVGKDGVPKEVQLQQSQEMLRLWLADEKATGETPISLRQVIGKANAGRVASIEGKARIYKKRGTL